MIDLLEASVTERELIERNHRKVSSRFTNEIMNNGGAKSENVFDEDFANNEKPKARKSVEDVVTSLRKELQVLYESLKDKNEQLMCLEDDVRDRDVSIRYLKSEYKKLKEALAPTCGTCHKKVLKADDIVVSKEPQPDDIIIKLQKDLKDREVLIKELNKKIIRLSDNLIFVQKESLAKDDRIDEMQRGIDKFQQVVRPFTKAVVEQLRNEDDFFRESPGVENTRVISVEPSRLKRTAIRFYNQKTNP